MSQIDLLAQCNGKNRDFKAVLLAGFPQSGLDNITFFVICHLQLIQTDDIDGDII